MIFKRGNGEVNSASIFVVDCISESRSWSRPGMQGVEFSAPLYVYSDDKNTSIAATRQQKSNNGFHHVFAADEISESSLVSNKTSEISNQFPLYITQNVDGRRANFDQAKLEELFSDVEQPSSGSPRVWPEDILDYIYASLHSPSYRKKYKEFLKTDFPKVPKPESWVEFWRNVELGRELRQLHLMKSSAIDDYVTTYPVAGDDTVDKPQFVSDENLVQPVLMNDTEAVAEADCTTSLGRVYINETQYFGNVPETAWNFYIGGYQPAQKWLKDRKGRVLSSEDLEHYQRIIKILLETDRIMKLIG